MKKTLSVLFGASLLAFNASADVISNYSEAFEGPGATPKAWLYTPYSSYSAGSITCIDGGHTGKGAELKQYSQYSSSYYKNYSYSDLLASPKVKGSVTMWVKKSDATSTLTVYQLDTQAGTLPSQNAKLWTGKTTGEADFKTEGSPTGWADIEVGQWGQVTMTFADWTFIGIRGNNVIVDDFTAEEADVIYRKELKLELSDKPNGYQGIEANSDNKVTLKFTAKISNTGDVDFADGTAKLTITNTNLNKVFASTDWQVNLPYGTSVTKNFELTGDAELEEGTVSNNFSVSVSRSDFPETLTESLGYLKIVPYAPVAVFTHAETGSKTAENALWIGIGKTGLSRTYWLRNTGTAALNVTAVKIDGDFSTTLTAGKIEPKSNNSIELALTGAPGHKTGKLTITTTELGTMTFDLEGVVTADGKFFTDFEYEGDEFPTGFIPGSDWKIGTDNASMKIGDNTRWTYGNSYASSPTRTILPKIKFAEGEKFYFLASKTNSSPKLEVAISADRNTFTVKKTITHIAEDVSCRFAEDNPIGESARWNLSDWKVFEVEIPAGEWYIALDNQCARIDNLYGGELVKVDHDIYVTDKSFSVNGNVNTRTRATISLKNINTADETDYKVLLQADGKTVAELDTYEPLKAGETLKYEFTYTPHATGVERIDFVFVSGDYQNVLLSYDFTINEEQAVEDHKVNEEKITMLDPIDTFYPFYQSEMILTAKHLNLEKGCKLSSLKFLGFTDNTFSKHIVVYVENTPATAFERVWEDEAHTKLSHMTPHEFSTMTKVFEGDVTFEPAGDGKATPKVFDVVFEIPFSEQIVYNGESLCFAFDMTDIDPEKPCTNRSTLAADNTEWIDGGRVDLDYMIRRSHDYVIDEQKWYRAGNVLPVVLIGVRKDIVELSGTVSDDFKAPIENAEVKLTADDNIYSAITAEDGTYRITVMKPELTYTIESSAEGFTTFKATDFTLDIEQPYATKDIQLSYTDRTATLSGTVKDTDGNPVAEATVSVGEATGTTDAAGAYSVTVPEFAGEHVVKVTVDGLVYANETHTFKTKNNDVLDFTIKLSGIDTIGTDAKATVTVDGTTVTVSGVETDEVSLYTPLGTLAGKAIVANGTAVFKNVAPGTYMISTGHKIAVR